MSGLSMTDISAIMKLIDGSEFDTIKLEMGDLKLELNRKGTVAAPPVVATTAPLEKPSVETPAPPIPSNGDSAVAAPLLGTFYHAPKPGAAPFVAVGDAVATDTVIGVIEVMKLMNTVTAGLAGVVTEIAAVNGSLVEHGQALIHVRLA